MAGRIMTRMTTDVDAMSTFLQTGLITMVNAGLTFVGVMIALLLINIRLGLTLFTVLPVLIVATIVFRRKSSRAYADAREKVSAVNADLQENVAGLRVAQAYRRERVNQDRFAALSSAYLSLPADARRSTSRCTSPSSRHCPPSPARSCCSRPPARCTAACSRPAA